MLIFLVQGQTAPGNGGVARTHPCGGCAPCSLMVLTSAAAASGDMAANASALTCVGISPSMDAAACAGSTARTAARVMGSKLDYGTAR